MKIKRKRKSPTAERPFRSRTQIEDVHNPALAADLYRRIRRAQEKTRADEARGRKDDAA